MVRDLFRDQESTEFIIATIPTVLGVRESARLAAALEKENIVCKRIIVNQVGAQCGVDHLESLLGGAAWLNCAWLGWSSHPAALDS